MISLILTLVMGTSMLLNKTILASNRVLTGAGFAASHARLPTDILFGSHPDTVIDM